MQRKIKQVELICGKAANERKRVACMHAWCACGVRAVCVRPNPNLRALSNAMQRAPQIPESGLLNSSSSDTHAQQQQQQQQQQQKLSDTYEFARAYVYTHVVGE